MTAQPGPTTPAAPPDDTQIRTELRRLNATKTDCLAQAQQMLAAQQAASAGGRLAEVDQLGQTLKDKMACVDRANQDLIRLQSQLGPSKSALFTSEDRFHQEYRQGLHAQLASLQRFSEQLADPDASRYDLFTQQVEAFRRQGDVFKNRYIRLLNEAETRELATDVFQATELLMASAQTWKDQVKAEAAIAELAAKGPSAQLARAHSARDAAQTANDFAAMEKLFGNDLIYAHSSAAVDSKASYIESFRSGRVKYRKMTPNNDLKTRTYGCLAVITGTTVYEITVRGEDRTLPFRYTAIWAKRPSGIEFVSWQSTGIPPKQ